MALLRASVRSQLRKDARELLRKEAGSLPSLAHVKAHGTAYGLASRRVAEHIARMEKGGINKLAEHWGVLLGGAVANNAYERELLQALRKNYGNPSALRKIGIRGKADARRAIAESRRRLSIAQKAERIAAKCVELYPKAVSDEGRILTREGARYAKDMDALLAHTAEYLRSLKEFYDKAGKKRPLGRPGVVLPPGFAG